MVTFIAPACAREPAEPLSPSCRQRMAEPSHLHQAARTVDQCHRKIRSSRATTYCRGRGCHRTPERLQRPRSGEALTREWGAGQSTHGPQRLHGWRSPQRAAEAQRVGLYVGIELRPQDIRLGSQPLSGMTGGLIDSELLDLSRRGQWAGPAE